MTRFRPLTGRVFFHFGAQQRRLTYSRWETARIKSYGTGTFIKGEEYDVELLAGIRVCRLFLLFTENFHCFALGSSLSLNGLRMNIYPVVVLLA